MVLENGIQVEMPSTRKVLYIGSSPPIECKEGLESIQQPLRNRYTTETEEQIEGIESTLTILPSGLQLVYDADPNTVIFFPIGTLSLCAAVRCVTTINGATGEKVSKFVSLSSPEAQAQHGNTKRPAIFTVISRRTQGRKILECHSFICAYSEDAMTLVRATSYASRVEKNSGGAHSVSGGSVGPHHMAYNHGPAIRADSTATAPVGNAVHLYPGEHRDIPPAREFFDPPPSQGYFYQTSKSEVKKFNLELMSQNTSNHGNRQSVTRSVVSAPSGVATVPASRDGPAQIVHVMHPPPPKPQPHPSHPQVVHMVHPPPQHAPQPPPPPPPPQVVHVVHPPPEPEEPPPPPPPQVVHMVHPPPQPEQPPPPPQPQVVHVMHPPPPRPPFVRPPPPPRFAPPFAPPHPRPVFIPGRAMAPPPRPRFFSPPPPMMRPMPQYMPGPPPPPMYMRPWVLRPRQYKKQRSPSAGSRSKSAEHKPAENGTTEPKRVPNGDVADSSSDISSRARTPPRDYIEVPKDKYEPLKKERMSRRDHYERKKRSPERVRKGSPMKERNGPQNMHPYYGMPYDYFVYPPRDGNYPFMVNGYPPRRSHSQPPYTRIPEYGPPTAYRKPRKGKKEKRKQNKKHARGAPTDYSTDSYAGYHSEQPATMYERNGYLIYQPRDFRKSEKQFMNERNFARRIAEEDRTSKTGGRPPTAYELNDAMEDPIPANRNEADFAMY